MVFGYQVHLVESDAIFDEFEVVPVDTAAMWQPFTDSDSRVHVGDALRTNRSDSFTLVRAHP